VAEDRHYSVEELVALCERHKIRRLKAGPNEIEMDASAFAVAPGEQGDVAIDGPRTDDDFLAMGIDPSMREGLEILLPNMTGALVESVSPRKPEPQQ
jgi:hypothetical protein